MLPKLTQIPDLELFLLSQRRELQEGLSQPFKKNIKHVIYEIFTIT